MSAIEAFEQTFGRDHEWGGLRDARLESCTLEGVDWSGKDLRGARFENCVFRDCDLSNVRALGLGLQDVTFERCKLVGFDVASCNTLGLEIRLVECMLDSANLEGLDCRQISWKGGRAHGADFTSANLEGVVFDGVDLEGALFGQTKLAGTDFRHATGWRIRPDENRVRGAKFRRDGLEGLLSAYDLDLE